MVDWGPDTLVGDVFKSMMSFFKSYTGFSNNFENALSTITACKKEPTFALYLREQVERNPLCGKLWLEDHLISPIQRMVLGFEQNWFDHGFCRVRVSNIGLRLLYAPRV